MPDVSVPDTIRRLAAARRDARVARDFAEADRLRDEIAAAGWRMVDDRRGYRLAPLHPADVVEGSRTRYGWSGAVPLRLDESAVGLEPVGLASVVLVAPDDPDMLERVLAGLAGSVDDSVQRVVVANAPPSETETMLARLEARWAEESLTADDHPRAEAVWTAGRFGAAAALNAGIRRVDAPVVILIDPAIEVVGDFVTPLVRALDDPSVAVAGPWGLTSADMRRFEPAPPGETDVVAIDGAAMAFRRADYAERGLLDEGLATAALLDAWWSLMLRDEGDDVPARRAVVVDVPLVRRSAAVGPAERPERRNRYRIIDRFGHRRDLADAGP